MTNNNIQNVYIFTIFSPYDCHICIEIRILEEQRSIQISILIKNRNDLKLKFVEM